MQVHTKRDIPFRDHTLNRRSVAAHDRGTNAPLAKALRERSDRVGGLDGHNCGTLDRKNARYVHDAAPATDERLLRSLAYSSICCPRDTSLALTGWSGRPT